ncbi:MAG: sigma-70 family RNA polymerase sigma factor [Actinobacteria bacterium]|nr:sigma-70 family RNA polymerase sigma factor [Actinomycetota bacterium]
MAPGVAALAGSRVGGASDEALLSATRAGSDEAFLALYDRYRELAWRVARGVAANDLDAEDAVAEGFARIYAAVPHREIESFRAYLAATVRNVATDAYRRRDRATVDVDLTEPPATEAGVEEQVQDLDDQARVALAFAALPERYRSALWLSDVERFSTAEIGHVIGTSANGAAALAMRARERLREEYLARHLRQPLEPACAEVTSKLASHVRGSASTRVTTRVEEHVGSCTGCAGRLGELRTLNQSLAAAIPAAPAGALAREAILDRVTSGGSRPSPPVVADGGAVRDLGSRIADQAQGLADVGGRIAAYSPSAGGIADRILQPVAAAVAGLLVAGAASIGAPGFGAGAAGADHRGSDRYDTPAPDNTQIEGRDDMPFVLVRSEFPATSSVDESDEEPTAGSGSPSSPPGQSTGSPTGAVTADGSGDDLGLGNPLPGDVGNLVPANPETPGPPQPPEPPPPDPCPTPEACPPVPAGGSIVPKIVDDVNDILGQTPNEADREVDNTIGEVEAVVGPIPEPVVVTAEAA